MNRIPLSTYRLQFSAEFNFARAREIVPYLEQLGITDIYASPITKARTGSGHGYDVVDHAALNPELGSQDDFHLLSQALRERSMGWLQDLVPNHMAFDSQNALLMDVLENGPESRYIGYFDIDWNHRDESLRGRLLTPFLGSFFGEVLENAELRLGFSPSGFGIHYFEMSLPVRLESYVGILTFNLSTLRKRLGRDHPDYIKLLGVLYVLKNLPSREDPADRYDQIQFVKALLWELYNGNAVFRLFLDENIRILNGEKGVPESFNRLDQLLSEQHYRLAFWKVGTEEINYRRFFAINELIALRVEEAEVFETVHALPLKLLQEGKVTGFRIDHIDGLYDPSAYLASLRERVPEVYLVVEKILQQGESLKEDWPVQGTTGYDFLNAVNGVFCRRENRGALLNHYREFTGMGESFARLAEEKKRLVIEKDLFGALENLAHELKALAGKFRYGSDFTLFGLRRALEEILVHFPVYRTYIGPHGADERDREVLLAALGRARARLPIHQKEIEFIRHMLLGREEPAPTREERQYSTYFAMRLQQFTGPLMAKGMEDTLLYVYNPLISLNEVGGEPGRFGLDLEEFHAFNAGRAGRWPHALSATQTHDTKRGEHLRARINVISEFPEEWRERLEQWRVMNRALRRSLDGEAVPDANDEYFLYQTLLGAYPLAERDHEDFLPRIREYLVKAVREAKVHTAWLKPDLEYEEHYLAFAEAILDAGRDNAFLRSFLAFHGKIRFYGFFNALAQTLLKAAAPGVPDFYQGSELWDLNLVDPDNRRPVDYGLRMRLLAEMKERDAADREALLRDLLENLEDGRAKLFLTYKALAARKAFPDLFAGGDYLPLHARGNFRDSVIAFARRRGPRVAVAVAPRFLGGVTPVGRLPLGAEVWKDTSLDMPEGEGSWVDALTGRSLDGADSLPLGAILNRFPAALLLRGD